MDQFLITAKLWPSGTDLDLGTDFNSVTVSPTSPSAFDRHAANFVTSMDGTHTYQFLFWNTGRRLTSKRHVHWTFRIGGWGLWTATRWYGTPGGPGGIGGPPRVHADAFTIGGNAPLNGTPIDGPASIFAPGAFPFMGNDHEIGTAAGAATVVAKDPFGVAQYPFPTLQFAGWLQLVWGGDDSDTFYEDDSGAIPGAPGFFEHASGPFSVNMATSADLLGTYGSTPSSPPGFDPEVYRFLRSLEERIPAERIPWIGDPSPMDRIRLKVLEQLLQQAQPGPAVGTDFQRVIEAAPRMSQAELKRSIQSVQTSLDLGKTALTTLESQLKRGGR